MVSRLEVQGLSQVRSVFIWVLIVTFFSADAIEIEP